MFLGYHPIKEIAIPAEAGNQTVYQEKFLKFLIFKHPFINMKSGWVYITSNPNRTVLYTGSSSHLPVQIWKHKNGKYEGFAKTYNCIDLIYYEEYDNIADAVKSEKQLKKWNRAWKMELILKMNPDQIDLSKDWFDENKDLIDDWPEF